MSNMEFERLKNEFFDWLKSPDEGEAYSKNTITSYSQTIIVFLSFLDENDIKSLEEVTDTWIRAFVKKLAGKGLKQLSIKNKLSAIQLFWEFSLNFPMDMINPVSRYLESLKRTKRGGRVSKRLIPVLYAHEVDLLTDTVMSSNREVSYRDMAIIALLLDSGVRSEELCSLTIRQISDMILTGKLAVIGKGNKERSIKVLGTHKQLIENYLERVTSINPDKSAYAFLTLQKTQMSQRVLHKMVSHYLAASGIIKPQMGGHLLRHTAASLMLSSGMTIKQVQDNLGHASIITTEKYLHLV